MSKIKEIIAREIKDSRGKPTVEVTLETEKGIFIASCPSGVSTGENEALELRDENGGVLKAIEHVNKIIAKKLIGKNPENQKELDELMIMLDGTKHKSKLGANVILPVSIAICRAGAVSKKIPLYQHIGELSTLNFEFSTLHMPLPSFNFIEGGAHAKNELEIQEFMIMPQKKTFHENMILANKIYSNLKDLVIKNYSETEIGDEGGFAPNISQAEQALYLLTSAIGNLEAKIAIDVAASEFYKNGKYIVHGAEETRTQLLHFYKDLVVRFPIVSIEDPFAENDWEGFKEITREMPKMIIIGDDLTTTNIERIKKAAAQKACNGVIIKPNQIGTVWEAIEAVNLVKSFGWKVMASHRGGETMDDFIADFAVGVGADFLKSGSPSKPERMVKYDRLLVIEQEINRSKF